MKFTVAIPNYNDAEFLGSCIDSILTQNYEDYEIWIYDNLSTDNSVEVAKEQLKKDNRIRLVCADQHHYNACYGLNVLLKEHATGEIALWLCADDKLKPGYFTTLEPYFHDPKVGAVRIGITCFREEEPRRVMDWWPQPFDDLKDIMGGNKLYPSSPFRMDTFSQLGGFDDSDINVLWDWEFWIRLTFSGYRIDTCKRTLIVRKIHANSAAKHYKDGELYLSNKYQLWQLKVE